MSESGNVWSDLRLLRRHSANWRKRVMQDEALPQDDVTRNRIERERAELHAIIRTIRRLEADRWQGNSERKKR